MESPDYSEDEDGEKMVRGMVGRAYDYHLEIANNTFGDMLHDRERNQKYYLALRRAIKEMHDQKLKVRVLDIGTGTGILAMMAVAAGADEVFACEAFGPMARCAERIISSNSMGHKIRVIRKHSTRITVGHDGDMPQKANLLITEVLDTELIGEGAISTYNHAHDHLLTSDAVCIPSKGTCYAQVVQSPLAAQWNTLKIVADLDGNVLLKPPMDVIKCKGAAALHDLQLSQLPLDQFRVISNPIKIFDMDFTTKKRAINRTHNVTVTCTAAGSTDMIFYWWTIDLDKEGDIHLSCAPFWAHPDFPKLSEKNTLELPQANVIPWRDHWMQAIYHIPKPLHITSVGSQFILNCNHDEFSSWFDAFPVNALDITASRHTCTCGFHMSYSRNRIGQINNAQRNKRYLRYLEENLTPDANVLCFGDGNILGLACAGFGANFVGCVESHFFSRRFMESLAKENSLENVKYFEDWHQLTEKMLKQLTHIFAEPYFVVSILPWDNFYFGKIISEIRANLSASVKIAPHSARIFAVPVEFLDLHKLYAPVGICEGFDLSLFDEMVKKSTSLVYAKVEPQPLWEYPCRALGPGTEVFKVVFSEFDDLFRVEESEIEIEICGFCNGVALWVDWYLDDSMSSGSIVSTGPTKPIVPGENIAWDMFANQGVYLMGDNQLPVRPYINKVKCEIEFMSSLHSLRFIFGVI